MAQRSSYRASLPPVAVPAPFVRRLGEPAAGEAGHVETALRSPTFVPPPQSVTFETAAARTLYEATFLSPDALDDYIVYAKSDGFDPRYAMLSKPPNWSAGKDRFPLPLCEFLAYKSVLAYEKDSKLQEHLEKCQWRGIEKPSYVFFDSSKSGGDTQGFGFVSAGTAYIIMRGSTSAADWRANLDTMLSTNPKLDDATLEKIGGRRPERHHGFALAWATVATQVEDWLTSKARHARQICLSGHSQGGALAIIGAHDLARRAIARDITVVTFAAPKVGGPEFVKSYNDLGLHDRTLRCESSEDAVTWLAAHSDFTAPGASWPIDKRPMISGKERFLAGLLFIAGWQVGHGPAKTDDPDASGKSAANNNTKTEAKPNAKPAEKKSAEAKPAENKSLESKPASGQAAKPDPAGGKADANKKDVDAATVIFYVLVAVISFIAFLIARRFIIRYRAHGAAKRYALYFTTLSYAKIREARIRDASDATDDDFLRASSDLDAHMRYIRGLDNSVGAYSVLRKLPVRVLTKSAYDKFVAETHEGLDEKGYSAPYANYIW